MSDFEPLTLSDGSVLSASGSGDALVVRRGDLEVRVPVQSVSGRFIVSANQQRAVLVLDGVGFEVFDLREGLSLTSRGERFSAAFAHFALSADGVLLATLVADDVFAKLVVRSLDDDRRSSHSVRLSGEVERVDLQLSMSSDGAVTIAFPWAAHSIAMSPRPPAVITIDVPHSPGIRSTQFANALASRRAIERLGDISLRYEPSMLIGETDKPKRSARPALAWTGGFALLLFSFAALLLPEGAWLAAMLMALGALAIAFATRLERHEKRQRRFVVNFATYSLRLDFSSPFAGMPKTLIVPFDDVKEVQLVDAGTSKVLVVELVLENRRLQEALVAFIPEAQLADAERLQRVLHAAFGLGEVPADSPIHGYGEDSTFT